MHGKLRENEEWNPPGWQLPARQGATFSEVSRLVAACRRQLPVLLAALVVAGITGIVYIARQPRLYTANSFILLDNKRVRAVESNYDVSSEFEVSASYVDSQVEVMKSAQVAEVVIKKLNLLGKLKREKRPFWTRIWSALPTISGSPEDSALQEATTRADADQSSGRQKQMAEAIEHVQHGLEVKHVPLTLVIKISYTASSPATAAEMANTYADAYITDQLNAKYEATRRASRWLEERLGELKQKSLGADLAVQKFRAENNLISSGGKLVNEQQLSELNTALGTARAEGARAEARYTSIKNIIDTHETKAVVSDTFGSTIIEQLRAKYLDSSKREAELLARLGPEHLSVQNLREEMRQYERLIFSELSRMAEGYRNEVNIAHEKESKLSASLEKLIQEAAKENELLVNLHDLERESDTYRNLYQSYLQRYQASVQQQSFPIVEARTITSATEPGRPSYPQKSLLLIIFLSLGAFAGTCIGTFREFRESGFSNQEQVRDELGLESLGIVPIIKNVPAPAAPGLPAGGSTENLPSNTAATKEGEEERLVPNSSFAMNYALNHPNSTFGEALLATKLVADIRLSGDPCKIIGVMSALPSEGKTVFAKNFASMLASRDTRALLIDGDLRKTELSRILAPLASQGLLEAVAKHSSLEDYVHREPGSALDFLPAVSRRRIVHSSDILASAGMQELLSEAKSKFDYVVIDLPPFGPVVDVRAIASHVDAFVLVIHWRRTPRRIIRDLLYEDELIRSKCLGVVLNKVDVKKIKLFEEHGSRFYHFENYKSAYYLDA